MARILVAADAGLIGHQWLTQAVLAQASADGHEGVLVDTAWLRAVQEADAVVAIDAARDAVAAACLGMAATLGKPALHLHGVAAPGAGLSSLTPHAAAVADAEGLAGALAGFYEEVRPFAGRLVRDRIPQLVREAGHDVAFRALRDDEKPHFLKQKIAREAQDLQRADLGQEKEEVADVLEALEALIRVRGLDRDTLRMVKQAKLKRRGGFERCFVVEATVRPDATASAQEASEHDEEASEVENGDAHLRRDEAPPLDAEEDEVPEVEGELVEAERDEDERPRTPIFEA